MDRPTIGGKPVVVGEILHTIRKGVPREVISIEGSTVYVATPRGAKNFGDFGTRPVKHIARHYYRKGAK